MPFTYNVRIENIGQVTFDPLALTDTLPAEFHYVDGTGSPSDPDIIDEPLPGENRGPLLAWNDLGALMPGDALTVSFAVTATPWAIGTFWNVVTATGSTPGDTITDTDDVPVDLEDPAVTINKEVAGMDRDGQEPDYITFTIEITNTGPSPIDVLPMVDQYDPYYLSFDDATPYPEQDTDDGFVTWNDLTGPAPHGFGRNLPPGEMFHITTVFRIAHDIIITTTNIATTTDVTDDYDNPVDDDEDDEDIPGEEDDDDVPTPVELISLQAIAGASSVRLAWATAAELDLDGFHIHRATVESLDDAQPIAHVPATGPGSAYSYTDRDVVAGQTYWYWLVEEVSAGDPDTYGPVRGGVEVDTQPYRLYLPLIRKGEREQSQAPGRRSDWLGRWLSSQVASQLISRRS
jgi:hypothetical protein